MSVKGDGQGRAPSHCNFGRIGVRNVLGRESPERQALNPSANRAG